MNPVQVFVLQRNDTGWRGACCSCTGRRQSKTIVGSSVAEEYSRTDEGALYSFGWVQGESVRWCPMNEEPLHLIPMELREDFLQKLNAGKQPDQIIYIEGDLCPSCRFTYAEMMKKYQGEWNKVIQHIQIRRVVLSEKDRLGIGTFQPKDEKNQDSTELTGDINYRKIAEYGSDSDPRAFNLTAILTSPTAA
jgi:serine protein kinase